MRKSLSIILVSIFATVGCRKDSIQPETDSFPFENDALRITRVTHNAPSNIRDLHFFNIHTGIAITYTGKIYRTTDGGKNWSVRLDVPVDGVPLHGLHFINDAIGYAVGGSNSCGGTGCIPPGGYIYRTEDGGVTWSEDVDSSHEFIAVSTNDLGEVFAISNGLNGRIMKRSDEGVWEVVDSTSYHLRHLTFHNGKGYCSGIQGSFLVSSDNGLTWSASANFEGFTAHDIKFLNSEGYCLVNNHIVLRTSDSGLSWDEFYTSSTSSYTLQPLSANDCFVFGAGPLDIGCFGTGSGEIRYTRNGGSDWSAIEFLELEPIRYTDFYSSSEGYALAGHNLLKIALK